MGFGFGIGFVVLYEVRSQKDRSSVVLQDASTEDLPKSSLHSIRVNLIVHSRK